MTFYTLDLVLSRPRSKRLLSQRTKGGRSVKYRPRGGAMFRVSHPLVPENAFESYVFPSPSPSLSISPASTGP